MGELMMLSAAQGCGPDVGAGPHGHGHSYTDQQQQLQLQQLAVKRQRSQLGDMLLQPWQFSAKRFRREAIADMQQLLAQHHHQMHFRTPIPMSMPQVGTRSTASAVAHMSRISRISTNINTNPTAKVSPLGTRVATLRRQIANPFAMS
ncbi:Hypothetical Protein FCC1311_078132 [Hondaea fermentalgiana]|uniref:Uncharacterized protein n=1 Tax=Hondaea fermentalgiana TaxID=2315210 RepID=A0A2R5GP85_9STRA|nr:Hypothetical Protein FCC1311_078132 [Hondaea fermentalgiana]|eukprot:GBG31588.1 Hypothetical Protein FCC1311_078132 [Hondaea fermentalgiana]